jgi:hypothetical protein
MVQGSKFLTPISSPVYECPSEDGIEKDVPGPLVPLTILFSFVGVPSEDGLKMVQGPGPLVPGASHPH